MTSYPGPEEVLVALAEKLEALYIEAIATGNPLQPFLAAALYLATKRHTFDTQLGVYLRFTEKYENSPAVQARRAELIREGRQYR